jgi:hypothetical protein
MKASSNNAPIIVPFNHASDAAGFFFGKSPKSRIDFQSLEMYLNLPAPAVCFKDFFGGNRIRKRRYDHHVFIEFHGLFL